MDLLVANWVHSAVQSGDKLRERDDDDILGAEVGPVGSPGGRLLDGSESNGNISCRSWELAGRVVFLLSI